VLHQMAGAGAARRAATDDDRFDIAHRRTLPASAVRLNVVEGAVAACRRPRPRLNG
jgi:hypothetical protein